MDGRFVAYYRVSTAEQGRSGLGLDAQERAVREYLNGGAWTLVEAFTEVESGKRADRPQLAEAIKLCRVTGARLVIAKLDRLARNVAFLANLMEAGVDFVCCDMPTANKFTIHIMAAVAQQEREAISRRTKEALDSVKAKLARGETHISRSSGQEVSRLGNPNGLKVSRPDLGTAARVAKADAHAAERIGIIRAIQADKPSLRAVADVLNERGITTPRPGGQWTAMTVKRVLDRAGAGA